LSKILVISATPEPFLEDHGGKQRLVRLTTSLSKKHDVTLLSLSWAGDTFETKVGNITHISVGVEPEVLRVARGRRTTLKKPNNDTLISYYKKYFKKYKARLNQLADTHDIIVVDHYATGPMTENLNNKNIPIFYSSQNCETDLAKQVFPKNSEDISLVNDTEKSIIDRSAAIAYCSKDDFDLMKKYFIIDKPAFYIPNGTTYLPNITFGKNIDSKDIVFIGSGHPPNNIAAEYILKVAALVPEFNFIIAGDCVRGIEGLPATDNVTKIKEISNDEVDQMFDTALAFINPMQSGSGTHLKMMKALSYGLPIITSPIGARGFSKSEKDACMIVCTEVDDMVKAIKTISDKKTYMDMSFNSYELSQKYDWDKIGNDFTEAVESMITNSKTTAALESVDPVKKEKILLYSIIRNENKYMNSYHNKLMQIVKSFPQFEFYLSIYENDSNDGTKQKLANKDWSFFSGVSIISEDIATEYFGSVKAEARVKNLAIARNTAVEAGGFLDFVDYVMMVEADVEFDMDTVSKILSFKNVVPDFDIVSGFTIRNRRLYDQWATRKQPLYDENVYPIDKDYRMKSYDRYYSTSNGICLYRAQPFREGIRHHWINSVSNEFDCEMVVVCQMFHQRGYSNIYIIHDAEIYHEHR
jgi:glycosyltransferase involved in cell wall biosynthesis